ncbi:MAG: HEAT repeat domain-containing protein, partial [Planctomycetes bacterium]|nr:HEAT repeat domain-containing protein [Planctomycetota bacterium]
PQRDAVYIEMLASGDSAQASAGARWLGYSESDEARKAILDAAASGGSPTTRLNAYRYGVRNLPEGPPVPLLLRLAKGDDASLRAEAIRDLGVLGHPQAVPLARAVAGERPVDYQAGLAVCEVLGAAGTPDAVAAILSLLEDDRLHANVRKAAVEQLRLIRSERSVDVLVKALRSKRDAVRAVAVEVLSSVPERRVTNALLKQVKREKEPEIEAMMLEALGDHGDPVALTTLLKGTRSKKPELRLAAVRGLARLGFHHDRVRAFFLSMLGSRQWEDRVLALDAARAYGDASLLPKVQASLDHRAWQVRLAAVEAMASLRVRAAVLPLIERLEHEQERRIRDAIALALFQLTGVNAADNLKTWRLWWSENGKSFSVPEEVPVLPQQSASGTGAGFYGIPVVTERVVFLIDKSGSMSAVEEQEQTTEAKTRNRLDIAVRETLGALGKLADRARVNVIFFDNAFHPWEDELQKLGPNRKKLQRELESERPGGGTNIYDGLEFALRMKDVDTIFLLSDGAPGSGKFVATEDILRGVRRENQTRRIVIHCVAVGMESDLLRRLASENGGRYARR